jgi:hypothetical protein
MSELATTLYSNKANILGELWMNYRNDVDFQDFIEYNDLGLPLAYAVSENIVSSSEIAQKFIEESFDLFIASLGIEDTGFENIDDVLSAAEDKSAE